MCAPVLIVVVLKFICLAFFNIDFFNFPNYISYAEQTMQDVKLM